MPENSGELRFTLGLKLGSLRRERGLSLGDLAERADLSVSYLSEIEKGRKYPSPERLLALARALGVPYDDLVSLAAPGPIGALKEVFGSGLVQEFPFELFGLEPQDLFGLVRHAPEKASALIRGLVEVGKSYDLQVEHFLLAALRSYQQIHANFFADLEEAAAAWRAERGWADARGLSPSTLRRELEERWGYEIDEETLAGDRELGDLRSVSLPGPPPRLLVNGRLLPSQKLFVLAREIGYRHLGLAGEVVTSSWIRVSSFDQLLANFRASYFAGALLMDREEMRRDLAAFFARERWSDRAFLALIARRRVTPEMFFYRLTELLPELFGLREIYFLRFSGGREPALTKVLNLSRVLVPRGIGLEEHSCRRQAAVRSLGAARGGRGEGWRVEAQRSRFVAEDAEFLEVSVSRRLVLAPETPTSVTIGVRVDEALRRAVAFWDDPRLPRVPVSLTCERCPLSPKECRERVAEPEALRRGEASRRKEAALARLVARGGRGAGATATRPPRGRAPDGGA